jgi:SHS2 domain-containing protein
MDEKTAGFREVEHTADWELNVWAPDYPRLLEQAALGMYALSGTQLKVGPRQVRVLVLSERDRESMLVAFLTELLYLEEMDGLGFDNFELRLEGDLLEAHLEGAPLESLSKEIKAVTYHNLVVRETERGLEVNIVFDV